MSGLRFIEANPFDKAFDNRVRQREGSRRARLSQEAGEFNLGESQRKSGEEQARNRVLSKTVGTTPRGSSLRDVAAGGLAEVGQGTAAFEQATTADAARLKAKTTEQGRADTQFGQFVDLLGKGDPESAAVVLQRSGVKITPAMQQAMNSSFFQREMKARFDRNKQAFKDPRQFEKQMKRDVVELLGALRSQQGGGVPQPTAGGERLVPNRGADQKLRGQPFPTGSDRKLFVLNSQGVPQPVESGGEQLTGPPSRAGRDPNLVTPLQRATLVQKFLDAMNANFFDDRPPEEKIAAAEAQADRLLRQGEGGLRSAGVPGVEAPQVQPDSAAVPAPAVAPPSRAESQRFFLAPLPMLPDGSADVRQLQVGQIYNTARGPARYTGVPGREFQEVR